MEVAIRTSHGDKHDTCADETLKKENNTLFNTLVLPERRPVLSPVRQFQTTQKSRYHHKNTMACNRKWVELGDGPMRVCVIKGDLTTEEADVIICAASKNLDLSKGRISKSVLEAAGQGIQDECKSLYPDGIGYDEIGEVSGAKMKCKKIYFVALPVYDRTGPEEEALKNILTKCLQAADSAQFTSLAMPALGTGLLKYPTELVAAATLEILESFLDDNPNTTLKDISVIVYYKDTDSYQAFANEIKVRDPALEGADSSSSDSDENEDEDLYNEDLLMPEYLFGDQAKRVGFDDDEESKRNGKSQRAHLRNAYKKQIQRFGHGLLAFGGDPTEEEFDSFGLDTIIQAQPTITANSIGNISIHIVLGKLAEFQADVVVNNTTSNLKLENGALAESLLKMAGPQLQEECTKNYPSGIKPGDVAVTGGYNLKATKVYHGSIPKWEKGYNAKKVLCKFVCNCLEQAVRDKVSHIAFPALGTGSLKFPVDVAAKIMIKCITQHESNFHDSTLNNVSIVVYDGDKSHQSVKAEFDQALADARTPQSDTTGKSKSPPSKNHFSLPAPAFTLPAFGIRPPQPAQSKPKPSKPTAQAKRGTKEWFKSQYMSEPHSPSYWTVFHSKKSLKDWHVDSEDVKPCAVPVDFNTFRAVQQVVQETWHAKFVGHGRDAQGLGGYTRINVQKVERIENSEIFEKYYQKRQEFFHKAVKVGQFKRLETLKNSSSSVTTEPTLSDVLLKDLYPEINEHYLFHGTRDVKTIINQGLDTRLAGSGAMFGPGIYFAESSTKADQYADTKSTRSDGEKKMFLVRVCLGEMYVQQSAKSFARPPCRHCQEVKCSCESNEFYHSVIGDGTWNFREFVVYDRTQVYPEYVITYKRV